MKETAQWCWFSGMVSKIETAGCRNAYGDCRCSGYAEVVRTIDLKMS